MRNSKIFWIGVVGALSCWSSVWAQTALQTCAAIETAEEKLACFEELAATERAALADAFAEPKFEETHQVIELAVTPEEARAELGSEQLTQDALSAEKVAEAKTAKLQARSGFEFNVTRSQTDAEQRQIFYMSDGQVWREIEPSRIYFPRGREFDVIVNRGSLGDYRLRVGGKGRFTRVTRLR